MDGININKIGGDPNENREGNRKKYILLRIGSKMLELRLESLILSLN